LLQEEIRDTERQQRWMREDGDFPHHPVHHDEGNWGRLVFIKVHLMEEWIQGEGKKFHSQKIAQTTISGLLMQRPVSVCFQR
jgi:hypothetical protein